MNMYFWTLYMITLLYFTLLIVKGEFISKTGTSIVWSNPILVQMFLLSTELVSAAEFRTAIRFVFMSF